MSRSTLSTTRLFAAPAAKKVMETIYFGTSPLLPDQYRGPNPMNPPKVFLAFFSSVFSCSFLWSDVMFNRLCSIFLCSVLSWSVIFCRVIHRVLFWPVTLRHIIQIYQRYEALLSSAARRTNLICILHSNFALYMYTQRNIALWFCW